jgi:AIG2-like family
LRSLDLREGFRGVDATDNAYVRRTLAVHTVGSAQTVQASTYVVQERSDAEIPPSLDYLDKLIAGAKENNLDVDYVNFLMELRSESTSGFRCGCLVIPTRSRAGARGKPIVRVPICSTEPQRGRMCSIQYGNRIALAVAIPSRDVRPNECEIDQSIRASLGLKSRFAFGFFVRLTQTPRRPNHWWVFQPRALTLPLHRPSMLDSEKNVCTLNRGNIALMGIPEGSYVTITAAKRAPDGTVIVSSISRRVFSGSEVKLHQPDNRDFPYPTAQKFYLDLDGRLA